MKQEKVDQDGTGTEQTEKLNRVKSEQNDETIKEDSNNNDNEDNIDEEEEESTSGRILFVKNLNFNTTDESLYHKFAAKFKIRSAVVSKKRGISLISSICSFYRFCDIFIDLR
ncbi:unnamed protein product [Anisakis simplex]|uniref:RRM domain-containing protein n=1 Tax=Anisakis simplex TaxID=6269 RepID=A0A3P6PV05_ANISI|nr:unnamed protein product [Anisakis simplex]